MTCVSSVCVYVEVCHVFECALIARFERVKKKIRIAIGHLGHVLDAANGLSAAEWRLFSAIRKWFLNGFGADRS